MGWRRKFFHLGFGLVSLSLMALLGREIAVVFLLLSFSAGLVILNRKLLGLKVPVADELLARLGRRGEPPGHGAFWFAIGLLAISCYVQDIGWAFASLWMLGVSDAMSGLVGVYGKNVLPHNRNKTFEGSLAFTLVSLVSYAWVGWLALPFALLGAFTESLDVGIDDNLLITWFSILFSFALRAYRP